MVTTDKAVADGLLLASDSPATAEMLAAALGTSNMRLTRSVKPDECLDLLGAHAWRLLILDAAGRTDVMLDVLSKSRRIYPDVPALVLVRRGDTHTAVQAMKAGASDCLETPVDPPLLRTAVESLCRQTPLQPVGRRAALTHAEQVVLGHILEGRTNQEIANLLCRSTRTIEVHRRHIMTKLGAGNLVELVKRAMQIETTRNHHPADR
ncbi:MAG TPA: response regulator transcription factor [Sedimentisphaerales bacterium]|nr:response regulator transcription factor [Sedimentisphaerales bacterium]HRS13375.1 response regulator transcription factor [Sedimentisphaerales bacterium]HRV50020.1 response regulator transcription factor [Sedimentisphaerales bacterium]